MDNQTLFQQTIAGYRITLFADGRVSLHKGENLVGEGSLDSIVLTQWGEAHLDGCTARLGKDPEETEEIYDQIDDALSLALIEDQSLSAKLFLLRNNKQLRQLAEHWVERLTPADKQAILQNLAEPLQQKIRKAEFLSPEQAKDLLARMAVLLRDEVN
jgi:hypothetical protein